MSEFVVTKNQKFGWCNDGHHDGCTVRFAYYEKDYQCACDCHAEKSLPPLVLGKNVYPPKPEKSERAPRDTPKKKRT